ncbi:hypothetical protein NX722_04920 [Endozoicomonas gorgoniicola]|uniref:Uncharacterized protein n=1 Tax=Endozoicomonas gorgoniicola TaxID=1234144 RepID=A0ABT3MRJ0_9GAMM|nr:hypothetical protein [Endozoicomonas gorgoniicola]MCW7551992.1 hypothetical protein [Endozoicomonas gorgoniicola]
MNYKVSTLLLIFSLLFPDCLFATIDVTWFFSRKGKAEKVVITRYDEIDKTFMYYLPGSSKSKSDHIASEAFSGSEGEPDLLKYMMQYLPRESLFLVGSNRFSVPVFDYDAVNFRLPLFPIGLLPGFSFSYRPLRVERLGSLHNTVLVYLRAVREPTIKLSGSERENIRLKSSASDSNELELMSSAAVSRVVRDQTVPELDIPESVCTVVISYQHGRYQIFLIRDFISSTQVQDIIQLTMRGRASLEHTYYHTALDEDRFHALLGLDINNLWVDEPDGGDREPLLPTRSSTEERQFTNVVRFAQQIATSLIVLCYMLLSSNSFLIL